MAAPDHAQQPAPKILLHPKGRPHMAMRYSGEKRLAALTPAAGARHVGFDPGFVDEHQAARIKSMLMGLPAASEPATFGLSCSLAISVFFKCLAFAAQERQTVS
ncbi:hypothetical protein T190_00470 [Sinorhizobium meliloti CCBAU 01290]|nr:hypothetical protein T190_00470 [Sinorhizobium meliloti CCBAU 01290]